MKFKNLSIQRIEKRYKEVASETLKTIIAEEIKTAMKNNIIRTVYNDPEGDNYERKFAMMHAVACKIVEDSDFITEIEVTPEPERMTYNYESFVSGGDYRDMIVEWLDKGTSGSPYYNHPANNFIEMTAEEANYIIKEALRRAFQRIASK